MVELKDIYSHFSWSYVDNFGMERHGNGRCKSLSDALGKLCKSAGVPYTDEVREKFGVNLADNGLEAKLLSMCNDIALLKKSNIATLDMITEQGKIVQDIAKPIKVLEVPEVVDPTKSKGGRPAGSKNKKKGKK